MPYRQPGAYARFVKTAGAVNGAGSNRILAIIGTGNLVYENHNFTVERDADRALKVSAYDELPHDTVFQVISVTNKPKYNGSFPTGTVFYKEGDHFTIKDNKYIVWTLDAAKPATVTELTTDPQASTLFGANVTATLNAAKNYVVEDGKWKIEVTFADAAAGAYKIVDSESGEVIGEYAVSATPNTAIPGVNLVVTSTNNLSIGEYVVLETKAAGVAESVTVGSAPAVTTALPKAGEVFYVSYTYKKPESGFQPQAHFDYDDVVAEYGNYDVTASGKVINSLALGAEIAFLNGAGLIVTVQAKNDTDIEIQAAIDKLKKNIIGIDNINTIIPLTTSTTVGAHAMNHVLDMSNPITSKERMVYLGAAKNLSALQMAEVAKTYNNERVVYVAPGSALKDIRDLRTGRVNRREIDSSFLAVAVAALGLKNDPAEPLTNKNIAGFVNLNKAFEESEMNAMAAAGVLVLKQVGSNIRVRHGLTTAVADVNSAEITLVQIKDYVIAEARKTLGELYVGNKLRPTIVADVQTTLVSILSQFVAQEVLIGYESVSVKRSKEDPRAIDVKFEIEAVYPLNYINIEFGFKN